MLARNLVIGEMFRLVSNAIVVRKNGLRFWSMISVWPLLDHRVSGGVTQLIETNVLGGAPWVFFGRSLQAEKGKEECVDRKGSIHG